MNISSGTFNFHRKAEYVFNFQANIGKVVAFKFTPSLDGEVVQLDVNYTITLGARIYNVANGGITITADSILWTITENDFTQVEDGIRGTLLSDSNNAPTALKWDLVINVC